MNIQQVTSLDEKAQEVQRSDRIVKECKELLVPQIATMKAQMEEMPMTVEALEQALETSFAEEFYNNGYATDPFYELISERVAYLKEQTLRGNVARAEQQRLSVQIEAEVNRRVQVAVNATATDQDEPM